MIPRERNVSVSWWLRIVAAWRIWRSTGQRDRGQFVSLDGLAYPWRFCQTCGLVVSGEDVSAHPPTHRLHKLFLKRGE